MKEQTKILKLPLKKAPFDVMITGEKRCEFRKPSGWIKSRLYNKDGSPREYERVQFRNGYSKNSPVFEAEFKGFTEILAGNMFTYSNGLEVIVHKGDISILLGRVL